MKARMAVIASASKVLVSIRAVIQASDVSTWSTCNLDPWMVTSLMFLP